MWYWASYQTFLILSFLYNGDGYSSQHFIVKVRWDDVCKALAWLSTYKCLVNASCGHYGRYYRCVTHELLLHFQKYLLDSWVDSSFIWQEIISDTKIEYDKFSWTVIWALKNHKFLCGRVAGDWGKGFSIGAGLRLCSVAEVGHVGL